MTTSSPTPLAGAASDFDVAQVRRRFPVLSRSVNGKPLVYFDNAATTQKPDAVIEAVRTYYREQNANIHRAVHQLSQGATTLYEDVRRRVATWIGAPDPETVIFTRGTTESINLVAASWGAHALGEGDTVLLTHLEHHSNIVPWQMACQRTGANLRVIPVSEAGELDLEALDALLEDRPRLVAMTHVSNAIGTVNPVAEIARRAHAAGAKVLVDGAQWVAHGPTDVEALGADFYVFSGHKVYGPTGTGVLWGRRELLEAMPPWQGGGDMIESVTFEKTRYAELPNKFEAGTPHIAGVAGLGAAIEFLQSLDFTEITRHETALTARASERLDAIPGVRRIGTAEEQSAIVSFVVEDPPIASLDVGTQLDLEGIAVRTGHHCCMPLMDRFGVSATARASMALYNTLEEVDAFADDLERIVQAGASKAQAGAGSAAPADHATAAEDAAYPDAVAESPEAAAEALAELFEFLPDWPSRYQQVIDFGEKLPPMPESLKTEANFVRGCQSTVHIAARRKPGDEAAIEFLADSDADIVRGLIGILQQLFSGQRAEAILRFDAPAFFSRLGLDANLSMTRRNGLEAMVQRIRTLAGEAAAPEG